jgi:hypothetical protein
LRVGVATGWRAASDLRDSPHGLAGGIADDSRSGIPAFRQDVVDHMSMHIGQPTVDARRAKRQSQMVDAEQVQDRGMQVVTIGGSFSSLIAQLVALAVR